MIDEMVLGDSPGARCGALRGDRAEQLSRFRLSVRREFPRSSAARAIRDQVLFDDAADFEAAGRRHQAASKEDARPMARGPAGGER